MSGPVVLEVDTLLEPGHAALGRPIDIEVGPSGTLFVADIGTSRIEVLSPDGEPLYSIGQEGSGPGELRIPRSLSLTGDTLRLVDAGNGRVAVFGTDGGFGRVIADIPEISSSGVSFSRDGSLLVAREGAEGFLALRLAPDGTRGSGLSTPRVSPEEVWNFSQIKEEMAAGRVPQTLRNTAIPILAPDNSAWLLLAVDGEIERYDAADSLLWTAAVPDTTLARLREWYFAEARRDTVGNRFSFPTMFISGQPVGDDLWILMREPEDAPARILVLHADGTWGGEFVLPGATNLAGFAVDTERGLFYLLDRLEGTLLRARY